MTDSDKLIKDEISEEIIAVAGELAKEYGARNVTVRKILQKMDVSNRVFYNRFANVNQVLEKVYRRTVLKMHESLISDYDIHEDFFGYITDITIKILLNTYDVKKEFNQYMFEYDSTTEANHRWWTDRIKEIIDIGIKMGKLKNTDSDKLSYTIWCFFRGFNADAVNRGLSKEEAIDYFRFGVCALFGGIVTADAIEELKRRDSELRGIIA